MRPSTEGVKRRRQQQEQRPKPSRRREQDELREQIQQLQAKLKREQRRRSEALLASMDPASLLYGTIIQQQQSAIDAVQRTLLEMNVSQERSPIAPLIHLGTDPQQRLAMLTALKKQQISRCHRYLALRYGAMDPKRTVEEYQMSESRHGHLSSTQAASVRVRASVDRVFKALRYNMCNMEIVMSEKSNSISLRECPDEILTVGDQASDDTNGIIQNRLVTFEANGLAIETNSILFFELHEANATTGASAYGVMALAFVEQDELYPYRPTERVRKDVTGAVLIEADPENPEIIIVKHVSHRKMHNPVVGLSPEQRQDLPDLMERWSECIQIILREALRSVSRGD